MFLCHIQEIIAKPSVVKISHVSSSRSFIILDVLLGLWCIVVNFEYIEGESPVLFLGLGLFTFPCIVYQKDSFPSWRHLVTYFWFPDLLHILCWAPCMRLYFWIKYIPDYFICCTYSVCKNQCFDHCFFVVPLEIRTMKTPVSSLLRIIFILHCLWMVEVGTWSSPRWCWEAWILGGN